MFYFKSKNKFDLLSSAESQIGKIVKLMSVSFHFSFFVFVTKK